MKRNMGITDRVIRLIAAAAIATLFFSNVITGTLATVLLILGAILFLTSLVGYCPLYLALGLNTRSHHRPKGTAV